MIDFINNNGGKSQFLLKNYKEGGFSDIFIDDKMIDFINNSE